VATNWEATFFDAVTPNTRKVALRSAMIMSPDRGGIFDTLLRLVRCGLGGAAGSGQQFISWIHDADFLSAIEFLITREDFTGCVNLSSPNPVPNREFMRALRQARGTRIGLPARSGCWKSGRFFCELKPNLSSRVAASSPVAFSKLVSNSNFPIGLSQHKIWLPACGPRKVESFGTVTDITRPFSGRRRLRL